MAPERSHDRTDSRPPVFRVLGPLEIPGGADLEAQPAAVLAMFLLNPRRTLRAENFGEIAKGKSLNTALTTVRSALKPSGVELRRENRTPPSYRLVIEPAHVDASVFSDIAKRAHEALRDGDHEEALRLAEEALDLWRDDVALPELQDQPLIPHETRVLNAERINVQITRFAAALALGRHREFVSLIAAEVSHRPTETALVEQLMLAYHRCGMTENALAVSESHREAVGKRKRAVDSRIVVLEQRIRDADRELLLGGHQPELATRGELVESKSVLQHEQHAAWEIPDGADAVDGRGRPLHVLDGRLRRPEPVGVAAAEDVTRTLERLRRWAESETVLGLFDLWQWDEPLPRPTGTTYLERFRELEAATEAWNYRRYAFERWQQLLAELPDEFRARVVEAAVELGMREWTLPQHDSYALGVALGGARRAPLCRTKWLELLAHHCQFGAFAFATSLRPIDERAERSHTTYAGGAETEFDLMHHAARLAPGLGRVHDWEEERDLELDYPKQWWASSLVRQYKRGAGEPAMLGVAAASERPLEHRPRTPETLRALHRIITERQLCRLEPGSRIVLVTSAIYVPYQQVEALRVLGLPFGLVVETVGHPREWTAAAQAKPLENFQLVGNYLQEMRSAIEACRRLAEDFPQEAAQPVAVTV